MSMQACNAASRGYTMGKARPAVITRAVASSETPPAGRARIRHRLEKLVISEATFAAPWHGRARPKQKHTLAKVSYASPLQAAASHPAIWTAACPLFLPLRASICWSDVLCKCLRIFTIPLAACPCLLLCRNSITPCSFSSFTSCGVSY